MYIYRKTLTSEDHQNLQFWLLGDCTHTHIHTHTHTHNDLQKGHYTTALSQLIWPEVEWVGN